MILKNFKVGFNIRPDTYTKKLGFINYQKVDGSWVNKKSYDDWIDSKIPEEFYDNDLMSGFVINNNVGYVRYGDGREPKFRIYDPRGFEIEVTLGNFCNLISFGVNPGKELMGEYQYAIINGRLSLIHSSEIRLYSDIPEYELFDKNESFEVGVMYSTSLTGDLSNSYLYLGLGETIKRNKPVLADVFLRLNSGFNDGGLRTINLEFMTKSKFKTKSRRHADQLKGKTVDDILDIVKKKTVSRIPLTKFEWRLSTPFILDINGSLYQYNSYWRFDLTMGEYYKDSYYRKYVLPNLIPIDEYHYGENGVTVKKSETPLNIEQFENLDCYPICYGFHNDYLLKL